MTNEFLGTGPSHLDETASTDAPLSSNSFCILEHEEDDENST